MKFRDIGLSTRITFWALLLMVAGGLMWIGKEDQRLHEAYLDGRRADLETALHVQQVRLGQSIETLRQDLVFLAATPPVSGIARASMHRGIDPRGKNTYAKWEVRLQEIFAAFLRVHPDYLRVSYIGAAGAGRELVRAENRNGQVEAVPHEALQADGAQDYFRAGLLLTVGRVYLSEFFLDREGDKIEEPHRPMLRAVTPVFDESGQVFGMLVIEQDVRQLFASASVGLPAGVRGYIADQQGRYLLHPDAGRAFAFEFGNKESISDDFPLLQPMFGSQTTQDDLPLHAASDGVGGYLAAERVFYDVSDPSRFLLLAYHLPAQTVAEQAYGIQLLPDIADTLLVMVVVAGLFMWMLRRTFSPLERIITAAREIADGNRHVRLTETGQGQIGELAAALNIMLDKLMGSELIESENRFRKELIESLPGIFYMFDKEGRFLMWNRNFELVLQRSAEELASCHLLDFFDGEDRAGIESEIRKVFEQGEASVEAELVVKDGSRVPYRFSGRRVEHDGTHVLIGLGIDITEHRRSEEMMRLAAATFETHEAILITDAHANIIRVNRAFTKVTGYSAEEVLGKNPRIMSSGRQDRAFYADMWQQLLQTGSWAGEIWDRRKNGEVYPKWLSITAVKNGRQETTQYVAIFSDISDRKRIEEEIRNMAFYDTLTQLPNRRLFMERLQAALAASARHHDYGALLFIDLDRFKQLNDTYGHDCGDLMLVEVANRIKSCVREMDTVARLGGDEFVVLLESISDEREDAARKANLVAEKIREALASPYLLAGCEHSSSPSIGINLFHGSAVPMEELIKHADLAMYRAKEAGGDAVRFYEPGQAAD